MKSFAALRSRGDYARVFRQGSLYHARYFTFRILKQNTQQIRVAIVVPKRVSTKATARNLLRRRIREYMRNFARFAGGRDIIIHAKQGAEKLPRKELYNSLAQAAESIKRKNL